MIQKFACINLDRLPLYSVNNLVHHPELVVTQRGGSVHQQLVQCKSLGGVKRKGNFIKQEPAQHLTTDFCKNLFQYKSCQSQILIRDCW